VSEQYVDSIMRGATIKDTSITYNLSSSFFFGRRST